LANFAQTTFVQNFKISTIKNQFLLTKSNSTIDFFLQGIKIDLDHTNNMILFPGITYSYENQNVSGFNIFYCNVNLDYTNNDFLSKNKFYYIKFGS
jgi:hypothetical protein